MASFNPNVPEAPEPNYLRYSRPSNFAPVNKGTGELIKTVGEGVSEGMKATDSVVQAGISSYIQSKGSAISEDYIQGQLEPEYQRLTGVNPRTGQKEDSLVDARAEVPADIKNLPGKVDALSAYKAKGGFVPTEYQSKVEALSKDLKSRYPGYSGVIEQQISRYTGDRPATAYAHQLLAGINAAESKIDNERKRKENIVDTFTKEGNISPVLRAAYDQGKVSMDYMINQGTITAYQKKSLEMDTMRNNNKESEIKLNAVTAGHSADKARDTFLAQTMKDVSVANGTETTPKFMQYKADLDSGKKQYLNPEEQQQFNQSMELGKQRFLSTYNQHMISSGLAEKMGSEEYTKKMKEAGEAFDLYHGMSNPKDYVQQHSFQKWMETKTEGTRMGIELSPTGEKLRRIEMVQKMAPLNIVVSQKMTDATNAIPDLDKDLHAFVYDKLIDSVTGAPTNGTPPPSAHTDINKLHELGYKGDAHQLFLNFSEMISDPKTPVEAKKNLVDYFFAGDGAKLLPQFLKEDRYAPTQNYNDMLLSVKQGRFAAWSQFTDPKKVDEIYKLGGQSWNTYKDFVDRSTRTMLGSEIQDLNGLAERGYKFSWDSDHQELKITQGGGVAHPMSPQDMRVNRAQNRPGVPESNKETVHAVNEVLKGIKNVAEKQPGIDVNAYLLNILTNSGLDKDNPAAKAIMDAIISSHKSSQLNTPGPTMSDATPDQVKPGQQYASMAKQPEIIPGKIPPEGGGGGAPVVPGTFDSRLLGREMPPEVPSIKEQRLNYGEPTPTKPTPPGKIWDLDKTQKKLDRTLKKAGDVAKEHTEAVESSYRKAEENIFAREAPAQNVIGRFRDHPREQEILENKLKSLQLQAKNVGPKGLVGTHARNEAKLIKARLKEIEDANEETE